MPPQAPPGEAAAGQTQLDNEGEYVAMDGEDDNAIQNLRYDPALEHVAAGRVYDVLNEGKLDPGHTRNRNYEFPVFRRR